MQERHIIETQLEFYRKGEAGCLFAAHAAKDPAKFGWKLSVCDLKKSKIEALINEAVLNPEISTQSIILPSVMDPGQLRCFLRTLNGIPSVTLEQEEEFEGLVCLGFRISISGNEKSYITGFGGFDFLPLTRQAVFVEITFRTKSRPPYKQVMKEAPQGVVHLADMDMQGMNENKFKSLWYGSFAHTEEILGHKPDLKSAAKTTFAVPPSLWK